jgi:hypothetical protein
MGLEPLIVAAALYISIRMLAEMIRVGVLGGKVK